MILKECHENDVLVLPDDKKWTLQMAPDGELKIRHRMPWLQDLESFHYVSGTYHFDPRYIKSVRGTLSSFVTAMAEMFPWLPEQWQYILDAAPKE